MNDDNHPLMVWAKAQNKRRGSKNIMDLKTKTINAIIGTEAGYVNNKNDSGGPTRWGVTEKKAREHDYEGLIQDLPRELAFQILVEDYWDVIRGDTLVKISLPVAQEVADTAVNLSPEHAITFLQRSLTALNTRDDKLLYPDVEDDGIMGQRTLDGLTAYLAQRAEQALVKSLNCLQGSFYLRLTERRKKDRNFFYGWLRNRVVI